MASASKAEEPQGSGGSNPSRCVFYFISHITAPFLFYEPSADICVCYPLKSVIQFLKLDCTIFSFERPFKKPIAYLGVFRK